jgi:hypothetical protein
MSEKSKLPHTDEVMRLLREGKKREAKRLPRSSASVSRLSSFVPDGACPQRSDMICSAPLDRLSRRGSDGSPPVALFGRRSGRACTPRRSSASSRSPGPRGEYSRSSGRSQAD